MKRNVFYITLLLGALVGFTRPATAQSRISYKGDIAVDPIRIQQSGETLHVEMDFVMTDVKVRSAAGVTLTPRLVSPTRTLDLPSVSIKGRNEYLAHERKVLLASRRQREAFPPSYTVEKSTRPNSWRIPYRYALPFEPWMKNAHLEIERDKCGCGKVALMDVEKLGPVVLERLPIPYVVVPHMAYIQPEAEIKIRQKEAELSLDFVVNRTDIRPDFMNNSRELAKIHTLIDELKSDPDITIKRLDIIGFASPEGPYENNRRLSEGRANALKNYVASIYNFPPSLYNVVFGGENWDGLSKALADLNVDFGNDVEYIINNYQGQDRKNRLKALRGGEPYRWLLQNVFPSLRVAIFRAEYSIKNFSLEEAREIFKTRPQNLSLNELFLVANSWPTGSQEFTDVFETAVRLFPENDVARLNAAAAALSRSDVQTGARFLNLVTDREQPEYLNAAGVLALLNGDLDTAERYLNQAAGAGLDAARENLNELVKKRASIEEINARAARN